MTPRATLRIAPGITSWGWVEKRTHGVIIVVTPEHLPAPLIWARAHRGASTILAALSGLWSSVITCGVLHIQAPPALIVIVLSTAVSAAANLAIAGAGTHPGSSDPDNWAYLADDDHSDTATAIRQLAHQLTSADTEVNHPEPPTGASRHTDLAAAVTAHRATPTGATATTPDRR